MDGLAAAAKVLADAGEPLDYREITKRALERGLWSTGGKTPEATINARLAVDIKRKSAASIFQRTAKGVFALRDWGLPAFVSTPGADGATPANAKAWAKPAKALSFTDAAEKVLEQHGNKKPMHYRAITARALADKLIFTKGQTPEATLYAQILTEIARQTRRGDSPRFVKHGRGLVGLTKWMGRGLEIQIEQHNNTVRKKLRAHLKKISAKEFEELVGKLLVALGFEDVTVTGHTGDGGIDVRGTLVVGDAIRMRMAIQAKRWQKNVHSPEVQKVRGSLGAHEQGLLITTSDYSDGARVEASRSNAVPVALMNGEQVVALMVEHNLGVRRIAHDLIELAEEEAE